MTDNKDDWTPERTELDRFLEQKELAESEKLLDPTLVKSVNPIMYGARMDNGNRNILDVLRTNTSGFFVQEARVCYEPTNDMPLHGMMGISSIWNDTSQVNLSSERVELNIRVTDPELVAKIQRAMNGYYSY